jgi:hypothetical protein
MKNNSNIFFYINYINIIYIVSLIIFGCKANENENIALHTYIKNELKVGETLHLNRFTKANIESVCALYPYQQYISHTSKQSSRINSYLNEINYTADEAYWSLVFIDSTSVKLLKFKRSENLDILATHEIQNSHLENLPTNFRPISCASIENVVIAKIKFNKRIYLIMGEMK